MSLNEVENSIDFDRLSYDEMYRRFPQARTSFLSLLVPDHNVRGSVIFVLYQGALYALPRPTLVENRLCRDWLYRFNFGSGNWEDVE